MTQPSDTPKTATPSWREIVKRALPSGARQAIIDLRDKLAAPPMEDISLHGYVVEVDDSPRRRLNLVIPSVAPALAFGGVITTIDIFLEIGRRCGADLRILVDDFEHDRDTSIVAKCAAAVGVAAEVVEIVPRVAQKPRVGVRRRDVFMAHNWWTVLNIQALLTRQAELFGAEPLPFLYPIQDYEPLFYPFSSTHMAARQAYAAEHRCWGLFNSSELHDFFELQGHVVDRSFVFEPRLAAALRPFLDKGPTAKERRILVYGRPTIPRNCYPAIVNGLRAWTERYPASASWQVVSAGLAHAPLSLGGGRSMTSLGKLSLADYAALLRGTAVGLSLMASPHPSYPPLEMAHFGLQTITNSYTCKDLSKSHANILSLPDIAPETIAGALAAACDAFERDPNTGWSAKTGRPSFLVTGPAPFLDAVAAAMDREIWPDSA